MADGQRLEIEHEVTCPICGALSERSVFEARMEMADPVPAEVFSWGNRWPWQRPQQTAVRKLDRVTFSVIWTATNAWLDCGHQVIRDGALVQDWRQLDEDVSKHKKIGFTAHPDGRSCSYHSRLAAWTFEGTKECLRTHRPLGRRPAGGALC